MRLPLLHPFVLEVRLYRRLPNQYEVHVNDGRYMRDYFGFAFLHTALKRAKALDLEPGWGLAVRNVTTGKTYLTRRS